MENPAIDPGAGDGEIDGGLHDSPDAAEDSPPRPKGRRRWKRWVLLGLVAGTLGALAWLNGPGLRWLGPMVAGHFMQKAGIHGKFTLEGSITGGISVRDLHIEGYKSLASLSLKRVTPAYVLKEVVKGRIRGIEIDGLHAELRLGVQDETSAKEEKKPLELDKLVQTLRSVRGRIVPLAIDLTDISLKATRDGKPVISLAPSAVHHRAGDSVLTIDLGAITDANGREWPAQESRIVWNADDLSLERVDPLPGVSVRNLVLTLPESGGPSAETELRVDDAVFMVGASRGFTAIRIDLREGRLSGAQVAERFSYRLPVAGELTSLSVNVEGLLPDPKAVTGEARLLLENVESGGWTVPELGLDVDLQPDRASAAASGQALGTGFSLNAEAPLDREGGVFKPGEINGRLNVADVSTLVARLADKVKAIDPEQPLPASMLDGTFRVVLDGTRPPLLGCDLILKAMDPKQAASLGVKAEWRKDEPLAAELSSEGLKVEAVHDFKKQSYEGTAVFEGFKSERIARWLETFRVVPGVTAAVTGKWKGSGSIPEKRHGGALDLAEIDLRRADMPPLLAAGGVDYHWPDQLATRGLKVQANEQSITVDLKLAEQWLEMTNLRWQDRGREMAGGSAKLPVPADFSKWREALADDKRPLELSVESQVLSLALLKDWLPAAAKLDPRSTGRVRIKVTGSYAEPVIDAELEAKDLRSPEQPKLPPADLKFVVAGKAGRLTVEGSALAPDFPPAVMTASMPFRPAEWAEDPALVKGEPVSARIDLPRIDVSRFGSLVADARKVSGIVTGNVEVAGTVGKPVFKGRIDLTGGGVEFRKADIPAISSVSAGVDLDLERVTLRDLKATVAGGTLQGGGALEIRNGKAGPLDFRVVGRHLPLKRDDSLIVRADADLRLAGSWEAAALTGTVGVVDSLFYRDIELLPIGTPFNTPSAASLPKLDAPGKPAASVPEPFRNWTVNVTARTANPFLIRGNFATGSVTADIRIGGTIGDPAPDGEVRISDLRAALPFSTLVVRSGKLRFTPANGFDPVLEIRGTAEPRPYRVNLYVYGKASDPQLVLTSSPPLPENEIMTLLATGTTTSGLEDPQAASSRAMQLLAEELRRGRFAVGKRLRPLLGLLDRVDFSIAEADPYTSEAFSTATLSITDRWYLSAGMGAEGDSRVMGIWRLSFR